jgi:hypothetical protein
LTQQRPPVAVPVLYWDGNYAYVDPSLSEFLESHVHIRLRLYTQTAGENVIVDGHHQILFPNPLLPGWLPANHPTFAGMAPVGASFGYNLKQHPQLYNLWPPQPLPSAVMFLDKGEDHVGGTLIPQGANGLVVFNVAGIWWMSDCPGDVPWPSDLGPFSPFSEISVNSSTGAECPRIEEMQLWLSFTEMLFATDKSVVTSCQPVPDSPIKIMDAAGNPSKVGSLYFDLALDFLTDDTINDGYKVFKSIEGQTFKAGYVTEGLVAGANVVMTADQETIVGTGADQHVLYQGKVTISTTTGLIAWELDPSDARLNGAKQRYLDAIGVMYLGLSASIPTGIRYQFEVPLGGIPGSTVMTLRVVIYGPVSGTLPALTLTYKRLPKPTPGTPLNIGDPTENPVTFDSASVAVGTAQYVEVDSDPFPVAGGDTVLVSINRAGTDGYSGEVGIIRVTGVLSQGA